MENSQLGDAGRTFISILVSACCIYLSSALIGEEMCVLDNHIPEPRTRAQFDSL